MDAHEEQTHFVKRVVLPSGKTIEVVYFKDVEEAAEPSPEPPAAEVTDALHRCKGCGSELVHPVQWEEATPSSWSVVLRCPECEEHQEGVFAQEAVDALDEELDRGTDALTRDYRRLLRANMAEEVDRFAAALHSDAILPEDF